MKITQTRENGNAETLTLMEVDRFIDKIKTETKARPVSEFRDALRYILPGDSCRLGQKLPKIIPASAFGRTDGVKRMKCYNGIMELSVGPLTGRAEVALVKRKAAELPQTRAAFMGSSGKSVKIWACFTRPDGTLPQTEEEASCFHAHAYRLAFKCYQPQLPFDIQLKEPGLEQYSRLSYDPEPFYHPDSIPFYLSQPTTLPDGTISHKKAPGNQSPLGRAVPGYDTQSAIGLLYEVSLRKTFEEMEEGWQRQDDLYPLIVRLAKNCFHSGIPEEEAVRRTIIRYDDTRKEGMLIRQTINNVYRSAKGLAPKAACQKSNT